MFPTEKNPRIERVGFELRAAGVKREKMNPLRSGLHTRGYLPHIKREGASYFVTFRLADSLPKAVLLKLQAERAERLTRSQAQQEADNKVGIMAPDLSVLEEIERDYFRKIEQYLDRGDGECWLRKAEIAELVADAFRYFEGERYQLRCWVIMPNHVHIVVWPMPNYTLSHILQSWKSYTGREANRLLLRNGKAFWQQEAYDHWIRNDEENVRCCRYVINNPVKARLCEAPEAWRWSSAWQPQ